MRLASLEAGLLVTLVTLATWDKGLGNLYPISALACAGAKVFQLSSAVSAKYAHAYGRVLQPNANYEPMQHNMHSANNSPESQISWEFSIEFYTPLSGDIVGKRLA